MTTLANLAVRCASRFRDTANSIYTATEWKSYLNDAYREVAQNPLIRTFEAYSSSYTVTTTGTASLPADTLMVIAVRDITNDRDLRQVHGTRNRNAYANADAGAPDGYFVRGSSIVLVPPPTATTTLGITYVGGYADLTDSDEPPFPESFHHILVDGAMALAHEDDGNPEAATRAADRFGQGQARLVQALAALPEGGEYVQIIDDFWG